MIEAPKALFYQQLDATEPLPAKDEDRYVDWQKLVRADDMKSNLARGLALSGRVPACRMVTGHRGVGKTTELLRVQYQLQEGLVDQVKRFVCFLEAERWLDLGDVRSEDVVFQIAWQVVEELKERAGFEFGWQRFEQRLREFGEILNATVELSEAKVSVGPVDLKAAIKDNPLVRAELRKVLRGRLPDIYDLINKEVLAPARTHLKTRGFEDIIVIVDQLDRVPFKVVDALGRTNHQELFLDRSRELRFLDCHVVYTVPVELAFSTQRLRLENLYVATVQQVPLVPVIGRDGKPCEPGVNALRRLLERRAAKAGIALSDVFASENLLACIIHYSGGHMRQLFLLLRACLERGDLPLTEEVVERALKIQSAALTKPLNDAKWKALRSIHDKRDKVEADPGIWDSLVRDLYVLSYSLNGEDWYDWNPLLEDARCQR